MPSVGNKPYITAYFVNKDGEKQELGELSIVKVMELNESEEPLTDKYKRIETNIKMTTKINISHKTKWFFIRQNKKYSYIKKVIDRVIKKILKRFPKISKEDFYRLLRNELERQNILPKVSFLEVGVKNENKLR